MTYNGWKNRETWNVALFLQNEYQLYNALTVFMVDYKGISPYKDFLIDAGLMEKKTPDDVKFFGNTLDFNALNDMMWEFVPNGVRAGSLVEPK